MKEELRKNPQAKIYLISLIAITIAFILFVLFAVIKPFSYHKFSQIKEIDATEILTTTFDNRSSDAYLVFIYQAEDYENELVNDKVVEYANKARTNKEMLPIVTVEYKLRNAKAIVEATGIDFKTVLDRMPAVIIVEKGKVSSDSKITVSTILTYLEKQIAEHK